MTTGAVACWTTWLLTDPSSDRAHPPAPREPRTIMSASLLGVNELLDREAVHGLDRDRLRVRSVEPGQHLVGFH